jgi:hypothetical protein
MRDWVPIVVAAFAVAAALANYRGTLRVSKSNEEGNHLKWLQVARDDAQAAKREADATREESAETRRELTRTKREVSELHDLVDELTRWTLRVIAAKDDPQISLTELRQIIDGGPPSIRPTLNRGD